MKGAVKMTGSFIKRKPFKKTKEGGAEEQYIDLGEMTFEDEPGAASSGGHAMVRIAEVYRYEDLSNMTQNLYAGNILIVDYSAISSDENAFKRMVADLKAVAKDTGGDVAGIGRDMLIATPAGLRVDRNKIKGSF